MRVILILLFTAAATSCTYVQVNPVIDDINFTVTGYIQAVAPDGTVISRHRLENEAEESCFQHARDNLETLGEGWHDYQIVHPGTRMSIKLLAPAGSNPEVPEVDITPPAPPAGVFNNSVTSSGFTTNWTNGSEPDLQELRVYRSSVGPTSGFALVGTVTAPVASYGHSGLTASTQYWVYVTALDNAGNESTPSSVVSSTTSAIVLPGDDPYDLYATDTNNRGTIPFTVTWPTEPTISATYNVPGDISYAAALVTANAEFNVSAGSYSAFAPRANDQKWNFASGATISGVSPSVSPVYSRIEVNGGTFTSGSIMLAFNDFRMNNSTVRATSNAISVGRNAFGGNPTVFVSRNTFTHCTFEAWGAGALFPPKDNANPAGHNDIIFAGCYIRGGQFSAPSPSEPALRFMGVNRGIVVDCRFSSGISGSTYKNTFRTHYGCEDIWVRRGLSDYGDGIYLHATAGLALQSPAHIMGRHWIYDYSHYKGADNPNSIGLHFLRNYDSGYWPEAMIVQGLRGYDHRQTNPAGVANNRMVFNAQGIDTVSDNIEFPYQSPPALSAWLAADGLPAGAN